MRRTTDPAQRLDGRQHAGAVIQRLARDPAAQVQEGGIEDRHVAHRHRAVLRADRAHVNEELVEAGERIALLRPVAADHPARPVQKAHARPGQAARAEPLPARQSG